MSAQRETSHSVTYITLNDKSGFVEKLKTQVKKKSMVVTIDKLSHGLAATNIKKVGGLIGWPEKKLLQVLEIPVSTYQRKVNAKSKLPRDESERLYRVVEVFNAAAELFEGDKTLVNSWMGKSSPALGDNTPLQMLKSEYGAREVLNLINALEHGIYT